MYIHCTSAVHPVSSRLVPKDRRRARALAALAAVNPFSDHWTALEREALGESFARRERPWSLGADADARRQNLAALEALTAELREKSARALAAGDLAAEDLPVYRELALFDLYNRAIPALDELVISGGTRRVLAYRELKVAFEAAFAVHPELRPPFSAAHWFAGCFQLRRAFFHIFRAIVGTSQVSGHLRAQVWEAIFTADAARYRRSLVDRMKDVPTLVLGETGTGKELVARAIGLSGFVPFVEERLTFAGDPGAAFFPLHLAAQSPNLVESALFGHKKGSFTGALEDRAGVFAECPAWGTVFLDEVGELDPPLQTKLLRVLEGRDFVALGENQPRRFVGRVVAATNRDLRAAAESGSFRRDVFFRLAGVVVQTPPLRERIADDPAELGVLVAHLSTQIAGEAEGPSLAASVLQALAGLPVAHPWPGNVRELSQQVRAVLVHGGLGAHDPAPRRAGDWLNEASAGRLSADELVTHYVRHVHARVGTFEGTARQLGLDRRTVKARVEGTLGEPQRT